MSRRKRRHLKSPRFLAVSSSSRSHSGCVSHQGITNVKVNGTRISTTSSWLISLVFHIKASYRPRPFSSMTTRPHSRDTIWQWKFKVKVKGTPVSAASSWLISLVFRIRASYQLPSPSFHDNRASHSWDKILPWKFKVRCRRSKIP